MDRSSTIVAIDIELHSAQACTIFVVKGPISGAESSKALRGALLGRLDQVRTPILVDFSQVESLDEYASLSLLAISFVANHLERSLGILFASDKVIAQLDGSPAATLLLKSESRRDAYKELCRSRNSDAPPFDILQFVREEMKTHPA